MLNSIHFFRGSSVAEDPTSYNGEYVEISMLSFSVLQTFLGIKIELFLNYLGQATRIYRCIYKPHLVARLILKQKERCMLCTLHSKIISHVPVHLLWHFRNKIYSVGEQLCQERLGTCLGEGEEMKNIFRGNWRAGLPLVNLQMTFDMRYGESSHSHQLQNSLGRSLCNNKFIRSRGMGKIDKRKITFVICRSNKKTMISQL